MMYTSTINNMGRITEHSASWLVSWEWEEMMSIFSSFLVRWNTINTFFVNAKFRLFCLYHQQEAYMFHQIDPRQATFKLASKCFRISSKQIPVCSSSILPSSNPNFNFLLSLLADLTYLAMLFILQLMHIVLAVCVSLRISSIPK